MTPADREALIASLKRAFLQAHTDREAWQAVADVVVERLDTEWRRGAHDATERIAETMTAPERCTSVSYRKKSVVIEALQWTGENHEEVRSFCPDGWVRPEAGGHEFGITTLEGNMIARPGDWIIKGVAGEFYPCKPDIFEATYAVVTPDTPTPEPDARALAIEHALDTISSSGIGNSIAWEDAAMARQLVRATISELEAERDKAIGERDESRGEVQMVAARMGGDQRAMKQAVVDAIRERDALANELRECKEVLAAADEWKALAVRQSAELAKVREAVLSGARYDEPHAEPCFCNGLTAQATHTRWCKVLREALRTPSAS